MPNPCSRTSHEVRIVNFQQASRKKSLFARCLGQLVGRATGIRETWTNKSVLASNAPSLGDANGLEDALVGPKHSSVDRFAGRHRKTIMISAP